MLKTNFTKVTFEKWALLSLLLLVLGHVQTNAQALACNNLVQVSVDATPNVCEATLTADMILEGNPNPGEDYDIEVKLANSIIASGLNEVTISNSSQYFNSNLVATVTHVNSGISCWGYLTLEDKLAPTIDCSDVTVNCSDNLSIVGLPTAEDNCDPNPEISLTNEVISTTSICANGFALITRTYVAFDDYGNTSAPCTQEITIERPNAVDFPDDIEWTCDEYATYPNIVEAEPLHPSLAITGSGVVDNIIGLYCNYQQSHSDQTLQTCGNTFKIVRTWTVLDWCTGAVVTTGVGGEDNVQVIKVIDDVNPTIERPPFSVSANIPGIHPQPCRSQGFLLPPTAASDNCNDFEVKIFTPIGEANYNGADGMSGGFIPAPGLTIGTHTVTYQITDDCGNQITLPVQVTVIDDIAPTTICDEITDINLSTNGYATVLANVFDDGTYDNCCLDHFEVRRMVDNCDDGHNDTVFGPSVIFCCEDLAQDPGMVVFRAFDCDGNYNDCMVEVEVSDKISPTLTNCPDNQRITCDWYADNLETQLDNAANEEEQCEILTSYFGEASFFDNCEAIVDCDVLINLDQCLEGEIRRTFTAEDPSGNEGNTNCTQRIFVDHVSDWVVEFPADITVNCGTTVPEFGEPEIFFETCELVAVSYDDAIFTTVADACYKIERTWEIINWCVVGDIIDEEVEEDPENQLGLPFPACDLDGDGDCDDRTYRDSWTVSDKPTAADANQTTDPDTDLDSDPWDGYITYAQIIKVIDEVDPVFADGCVIPNVCIEGNTCGATVILPEPAIDDCSTDVEVTAEIYIGGQWVSGFGPFLNVPPGTYEVRYTAEDNCNNQTACESEVTVEDCKKPTPYCKNGIIVELMTVEPAMVEVWASDLNAGSFDNCPGTLEFSFSSLVSDNVRTFTCDDIGQNAVEMWVTDAFGNQDYCETFVIIQANMGQCGGSPLVSVGGALTTEDDMSVEGATVTMSNESTGTTETDNTGSYLFTGIDIGNDVTITPELDDDHLNGVSTFDILLITKHILGIQALDSPYKMIAADANNSGAVTTADVLEIRKLILQISESFTNNTSWRFVDKGYDFPNPNNPWEEAFPEIINVNDIAASVLDADFTAVKIGDVNGSASLAGVSEDRSSNGVFQMSANDAYVQAGETFTVQFDAEDVAVQAFQFTLNFDEKALELNEVVNGIATDENFGTTMVNEGVLTTSWASIDDVANGQLFSLTFTANQAGQLSDLIKVNSRFTRAEAYTASGNPLNVELNFSGQVANGFELYQNTPNPFKGQTVIGFNIPEAGQATLTVTDISGKVINVTERDFATGYNQVQLNSNELPSSGVLYYTLETANETATKKMVVIE